VAGLGEGYFIPPTVFVDVPVDAAIWREEVCIYVYVYVYVCVYLCLYVCMYVFLYTVYVYNLLIYYLHIHTDLRACAVHALVRHRY
jgi:hypothetical protein